MLGTYLRLKNRFESRQEGQGLVEYALILVLVSVVAITSLTLLGPSVNAIYSSINATLALPAA